LALALASFDEPFGWQECSDGDLVRDTLAGYNGSGVLKAQTTVSLAKRNVVFFTHVAVLYIDKEGNHVKLCSLIKGIVADSNNALTFSGMLACDG
jgi:hypothetical protein